ncbi:non-SMC mitotic condensation complex subunit 1-domain-containing protein [Paraphysoderma sedebokerense]|nr:non-SMC mitotic condensation complex subunit 1-domain-containing protein [Paraphysoderma sedebokerense]
MDSSHPFDLNQELVNIQNKDEYLIPNSFSIEHLSARDAKMKFDDIIDRIEADPTSITNSHTFDTLRVFIKSFAILQNSHASRIFDILTSGLKNLYDIVSNDISNNNVQNFESDRTALEMYMFLLHWLLIEAQNKASSAQQAEKAAALTKTKARGRGKAKKDDNDDFDWESYRKQSLKIMADYVHLKLSKIFPSGNDRDLLISLFTKPLYHLLKNGEKTVLKCSESKSSIFNILASCVSHYNHGFSAQTSIIQNLQYFEFLSEPMAEFLHELHQREHSQLTDDILREIGKRSIGKDDTAMAKSVSKFIIKLSMLCPHDVLRQMVYLQSHLDSESYIMRAAMIETIGNLICLYIKQEMSDASKVQLQTFLAILEERFRDSHTQCRKKVLQVCYDVCESGVLTLKRRKKFLKMTISRLQDKNQPVRATAVKLVRQYLEIHPFKLHAGSLGSNFLQSNLQAIMDELKELRNKLPDVFQTAEPQQAEEDDDEEEIVAKAEPTAATEIQDSTNIGASSEDLQNQQRISEAIMTLEVKRRYYEDALDFVEQMNHAAPILCQLLASRNKGEVTDAMDFFVAANAFKLDCAEAGIKKMIHLIWSKDVGSADGSSIKDHLMDCFQLLFLSADKSLNPKERISLIVKNLISLTYNTTLAELTSLQQLFHTMMTKGYFEEDVIRKLWTIYGAPNRDIPKQQRRGAILIIGWLASASPDVVKDKLDILLKVGCGSFGKDDLVLAKYSCLAIQQLTSGQNDKAQTKNTRLGNEMLVFSKLTELLLETKSSVEWFGMAEQTINTMYLLAEHPDGLCTEIIKQLSQKVLDISPGCPVSSLSLHLNAEMPPSQGLSQQPSQPDGNLSQIRAPSMEECIADPLEVSKLLFVVGHVAIKQIVHLEHIEAEYKRTKGQSKGLTTSSKNASSSDDLDQVVGSVEDDFADAIATVRERELLYAEKSLLAVFGPIITHICANNRFYSNRNLQNSAVLALCKFMCVSSTYCEKHLPLLFNILAKSNEPIIRSNIIIAIGDMAVCFNTLIDQNISFLYDRLNDADNAVKKNALMVLTHLILNGMVKVKGQLSEMAKCVESSDQRISDLAKLFFTELATKDNAIYNNLPDIISNLTSSERPIEEETFHKIMKFLFNFITKERQTENIIEKLCLRFKESNDPRQWRDIAYCLTLLPYSMEKADDSGEMRSLASTGANRTERNVKKLAEGLVYYSDKLHEDTVYKHIKDILQKASKIGKTEIKQFIEEFDTKIEAIRVQCQNNMNAEQEAVAATKTPAPKNKITPKVSPTADTDVNIDEAVEALGALSLANQSPTIGSTSRLSNLKKQSTKSNVPSARNSQVRTRISKSSANPNTKENIELINTTKQKMEEPGAAKVSSTRLALRTSSRSNVSLLRKPKEPLGQKSADSENSFSAKR